MIVYLNGGWVDAASAGISVEDLGFLTGHAVFDTARLLQGRYVRLGAHLDRLAAGAERLRIDAPRRAELRRIAFELVRRNDIADGVLRITLTRGVPGPGAAPTVLATLRPLPADWLERATHGWRLITSTVPHPTPAPHLAGIKTPGRLHGLLARIEAEDAGVDDALLLSRTGMVTEGPSWNVFWRAGDELRTPSPDLGILDGVTRGLLLEVAAESGYRVVTGIWPRGELDAADEIWATMTSLGLVRIRELDGRPLPGDAPAFHDLTRRYWQRAADLSEAPG